MPQRSSSSAGATYLDRERRVEEVRQAARRAVARLPCIRRMLLFGSLRSGGATLRSDADVLVVLDRSDYADARERIPEVLRAMAPLPCPIDLFVMTVAELERTEHEASPLARIALTTGVDLL